MNYHIETERLLLRDLHESDAQHMFELDSDPEVHKYLGNKPFKDINQSEEYIADVIKQYKENGIGRWAIINKQAKEFMGYC